MCLEFHALNKITFKVKFPIPVIGDLLDEIKGAQFFTKHDLFYSYYKIKNMIIPKICFTLMNSIMSSW
jgi:hypothetical protein